MSEQQMNVGDFCWVELLIPNVEQALGFYQPLFGWGVETSPVGDGDTYTMLKVQDKHVAGVYAFNEEMKSNNMPPHWASYVWVEDADAMAQKAEQLGGKILKAPFDVSEYGRMAVLADPTGAAFCVWQPKGTNPAESLPKNTPGMFGWNELMTRDTERAEQFYTQLFGWQAKTQQMPHGTDYTTFFNGETPVGGMLQPPEDCDAPSYWGVYFSVANFDETLEKAKSQGGKTVYEPKDIPTVGRFTMIQDTQGAYFSIIQFEA